MMPVVEIIGWLLIWFVTAWTGWFFIAGVFTVLMAVFTDDDIEDAIENWFTGVAVLTVFPNFAFWTVFVAGKFLGWW